MALILNVMQIIVGCVDAEPKSVVSLVFHRNKFEFEKKINAKCRILIHLLFTIRCSAVH